MSGRNSLAAGALALALAAPASAQQVAAAPLGQTDPWGVGWLGRADGALPATFWANTNTETLTPLFAELKPASLAPSARLALRKVMLSGAKGPAGDADLIPERLRVIEQLGEAERAIDLQRKFPKEAWTLGGDRLASDMDLVAGRNETACARVTDKRADDPMWMPVRALCYAVAKDFNAAGMVAEQTLDKEGKPDVWLISAIETIREPTKTKPPGRYGSAFDAAVSVAGKLSVPANAMVGMPSDVAAAIVKHPLATNEQKRAALRIAVETSRVNATDVLAVLNAPKDPAPAPAANQRAAAQRPSSDFLALALEAAAKADMPAEAKSAAYAAALKSGDSPADARIAALALNAPLKALAKTQATLPNAETFARAGLLAGDVKLAQDWRKLMDLADGDNADLWAEARLDLLLSFAGVNADKSAELLERLVEALPPADDKTKLAATAQRQLDLRRIETARVMFLYVGAGRALPPAARAQLATQKNAGRGVADAALARIQSAAEADADGEAALAAIAQLGPDVSAVSFSGLADLLTQLRRVGLAKEADAIALESLQVWKAL